MLLLVSYDNSGKITFPSCLKLKAAYEEKYIVIMAGDDLPTYLATPAGNKCVCSHEGEVVILEEGDAAKREESKQNDETTIAWRRPRRLEKTKVRSTNVYSFNFLHQHHGS
ncbi:hypothetical protein HID58_058987 [Brassica napus]|uniref:Uncharacterized protein n=1 Tax=Brassica napus TaxID=3708 RepID=A0ABQ7ZSA9_BRANA|nr:hypothetical protein HID58_058987 [Brassica napus]